MNTKKQNRSRKTSPTKELVGVDVPRLVRLDDVIRIVSEHPEYPEPCPMLHDVASKAAAEMDKEWVMHMVRETCRQTKEAILADIKQSLPNEQSPSAPD